MKSRAKEPSWIKKIFFGIVGFGIILGFCWSVARFIGGGLRCSGCCRVCFFLYRCFHAIQG